MKEQPFWIYHFRLFAALLLCLAASDHMMLTSASACHPVAFVACVNAVEIASNTLNSNPITPALKLAFCNVTVPTALSCVNSSNCTDSDPSTPHTNWIKDRNGYKVFCSSNDVLPGACTFPLIETCRSPLDAAAAVLFTNSSKSVNKTVLEKQFNSFCSALNTSNRCVRLSCAVSDPLTQQYWIPVYSSYLLTCNAGFTELLKNQKCYPILATTTNSPCAPPLANISTISLCQALINELNCIDTYALKNCLPTTMVNNRSLFASIFLASASYGASQLKPVCLLDASSIATPSTTISNTSSVTSSLTSSLTSPVTSPVMSTPTGMSTPTLSTSTPSTSTPSTPIPSPTSTISTPTVADTPLPSGASVSLGSSYSGTTIMGTSTTTTTTATTTTTSTTTTIPGSSSRGTDSSQAVPPMQGMDVSTLVALILSSVGLLSTVAGVAYCIFRDTPADAELAEELIPVQYPPPPPPYPLPPPYANVLPRRRPYLSRPRRFPQMKKMNMPLRTNFYNNYLKTRILP